MELKKHHELPLVLRGQIIGFLQAGKGYAECSSFYGVPESTVRYIYNKFIETGEIEDIKRTGRPPLLDVETKNSLINELENTEVSSREAANLYLISHSSVQNYAHESGLSYKIPEIIPKLSSKQIEKRFEFCKINRYTSRADWIFSDESSFECFHQTLGIWTHEEHPVKEIQKSKKKLLVWAAI